MTEPSFDSSKLTFLAFGLPGKIYRSPMPFGSYDPRRAVLAEALAAGVQVVVDLVPDEEALQKTGLALREMYTQQHLDVIYSPIEDFSIPERGDLKGPLQAAIAEMRLGRNLIVHCNAGLGRTGVFTGCLAREIMGQDGPQAVAWVRQFIPTALENELQVKFVYDWK